MYFYLILALQGYCVYHCFTNRNSYYWIFAIVFLPLIGCLLYLFMNVLQKRDVAMVQDGLTAVINPGKKITDLERKLQFADTFENRAALADTYLDAKMYDKAIKAYHECLSGTFQNDFYVISKLLEAYYASSDVENAIEQAERIQAHPKFKKSKAAFLYALALEKKGEIGVAESYLSQFDAPYSRYPERLELARFYIRNNMPGKARELLNEMVQESQGTSKPTYRENRLLINSAKELLATVS